MSEHCCVHPGYTPTCCSVTWWPRAPHLSCPSRKPPRHEKDKATMVSEAVRQVAATAPAAAQLQFGKAVNVQVVEQGFLPGSDNNEIDDLIERLRPTTNGILAKLNMEQMLRAHLDD